MYVEIERGDCAGKKWREDGETGVMFFGSGSSEANVHRMNSETIKKRKKEIKEKKEAFVGSSFCCIYLSTHLHTRPRVQSHSRDVKAPLGAGLTDVR